ncbi:hypothetical protein FQA39_LY12472 [Lamprigera yunnana]|nr:hypothetical protein FQA39_LY12472 [Lamprigera yunnana]
MSIAPHTCVYYNCFKKAKRYSNMSFFKFPMYNEEQLKKWIINCGNAKLDTANLTNKLICEDHFLPNQLWLSEKRKILRSGAVPIHWEDSKNGQEGSTHISNQNMPLQALMSAKLEGLFPVNNYLYNNEFTLPYSDDEDDCRHLKNFFFSIPIVFFLAENEDAILNKFASAEEEEMYHGGNNKSEEEYLNHTKELIELNENDQICDPEIGSNVAKCNNGEERPKTNDITIEKEIQTPNATTEDEKSEATIGKETCATAGVEELQKLDATGELQKSDTTEEQKVNANLLDDQIMDTEHLLEIVERENTECIITNEEFVDNEVEETNVERETDVESEINEKVDEDRIDTEKDSSNLVKKFGKIIDQQGKQNRSNDKIKIDNTVNEIEKNYIREVVAVEICEPSTKSKDDIDCGFKKANDASENDVKSSVPTKISCISEYLKRTGVKKLTKEELEQICLIKICEAICYKSEIGELRYKLGLQEKLVEMWRSELFDFTKYMQDLEVAHRKLLCNLKSNKNEPLMPIRITRSVGVGVRYDDNLMSNGLQSLEQKFNKQLTSRNVMPTKKVQTRKLNKQSTSTNITPAKMTASVGVQVHCVGNLMSNSVSSQTEKLNEQSTSTNITPTKMTASVGVQVSCVDNLISKSVSSQTDELNQQSKSITASVGVQIRCDDNIMNNDLSSEQQMFTKQLTSTSSLPEKGSNDHHKADKTSKHKTIVKKAKSMVTINKSSIHKVVKKKINPFAKISLLETKTSSKSANSGRLHSDVQPSMDNSFDSDYTSLSNSCVQSLPLTLNTLTSSNNIKLLPNTSPKPAPKSTDTVIDLSDEENESLLVLLSGSITTETSGATTVARSSRVINQPRDIHNINMLQKVISPGSTETTFKKSKENRNIGLNSASHIITTVVPTTSSTVTTQLQSRLASTVYTNPFSTILKHPAALPSPPAIEVDSTTTKAIPPKPDLSIKKSSGGIVLSWKMPYNLDNFETILGYQLYAYEETSSTPNSDMWRKIGEVKALTLPMACTLTEFTNQMKYHFAIRAFDTNGRVGPFSDPQHI